MSEKRVKQSDFKWMGKKTERKVLAAELVTYAIVFILGLLAFRKTGIIHSIICLLFLVAVTVFQFIKAGMLDTFVYVEANNGKPTAKDYQKVEKQNQLFMRAIKILALCIVLSILSMLFSPLYYAAMIASGWMLLFTAYAFLSGRHPENVKHSFKEKIQRIGDGLKE
ncbi:MAG: hypothetical protein LBR25_08660 [Erysipelotrichaceae bacterium]|nr:hypothetical protein [Erysipelotrichaceae bacterium]